MRVSVVGAPLAAPCLNKLRPYRGLLRVVWSRIPRDEGFSKQNPYSRIGG